MISQVLINLIRNSIEALSEINNGSIELWAEKNIENQVIIKVSDNGKGVSEDILEKIFIPFFTTKDSGNGIGLSLCRQIIRLHKGSLSLQSIKGKGATFTIKI